MEEGSVLVIRPVFEYFLVPYHTAGGRLRHVREAGMDRAYRLGRMTYRYVNQLQPVGISHQVVGEHDSALQTGVSPS